MKYENLDRSLKEAIDGNASGALAAMVAEVQNALKPLLGKGASDQAPNLPNLSLVDDLKEHPKCLRKPGLLPAHATRDS